MIKISKKNFDKNEYEDLVYKLSKASTNCTLTRDSAYGKLPFWGEICFDFKKEGFYEKFEGNYMDLIIGMISMSFFLKSVSKFMREIIYSLLFLLLLTLNRLFLLIILRKMDIFGRCLTVI